MLDRATVLKWYKQAEVCEALSALAVQREIAVCYGTVFGKRPDQLTWPRDVLAFAMRGATSFHCSVELWSLPSLLKPGASQAELGELRIGWDLLIDIDSPTLELSSLAAVLLLKLLKQHGLTPLIKFSGNRGWHALIPWQAFPKSILGRPAALAFPELPRAIIGWLAACIEKPLAQAIAERVPAEQLRSIPGAIQGGKINAFAAVSLDTMPASPRHLYRMPWCFNEKTGLLSIPIKPDQLEDFELEDAQPRAGFSGSWEWKGKGQAAELCQTVLDIKKEKTEGRPVLPKKAVAPPCISTALQGLPDGRKRALFVLINYFGCLGCSLQELDAKIQAWNQRNSPPLPASYVRAQLDYFAKKKTRIPPPNCSSELYKAIGICRPDSRCAGIKNPLRY